MKTSVLKNYRVLKKLGQGGMGMVYLAEDVALGRQVALKFLAPYLLQDPEIMGRFRAEARNQARLVHPHVTLVYAFQEFEDQAFLVLEYLDGETLENRIRREGKIPVPDAVAIMRDILSGVGYAHKKGVVHRDIKPGNIGFTSDGRVKLMDFGIALDVDETQRLTRTGHTLGTPHYMAPEQILGEPADGRADIYALGITLFEMLTGRVPFEGSDYEVRVAQINHPPPSPCAAGCPDLPEALEKVVLKALAKDQKERFATAGEFRRALEAAATRPRPEKAARQEKTGRPTEAMERVPASPPLAVVAAGPPPLAAEAQIPAAAPPPPSKADEAEPGTPGEAPLAEPAAAPPSVAKPMGRGWRVFLPVSLGLAALLGAGLFWGFQKFPAISWAPRVTATPSTPPQPMKKPEPVAAVAEKERPKPSPSSLTSEKKTAEESIPGKSQPPPEKPKAIASLSAPAPKPEPKPEVKPEVKPESKPAKTLAPPPPPPDYQKIVKEKLAENGLSGIKVTQDKKNRVIISGTVKSQSQKDKVVQVVSGAALSVPVDFKLVVAAEPRPKPALPRLREVLSDIPESSKRPMAPKPPPRVLRPSVDEVPRKPLPPRLD